MNLGRKGGYAAGRQGRRQAEFARAVPLRQLFPELAELRIEIDFEDGSPWAPSSQSFSYFPAARGFFRYACPCHACNGEFDLTTAVQNLVSDSAAGSRRTRLELRCAGERTAEQKTTACDMRARVRLKAVSGAASAEA